MPEPADQPAPDDSPLDEVIARSNARLDQLVAMIEADGLEEGSLGDAYLDRRGADVLGHLHGWHGLFEAWCREDSRGHVPELPAPGYTWQGLRELNDDIYERYRGKSWDELLEITRESHARMIDLLATYPEASLLDPDRFAWAGGSLLALADECLGKHYDWGVERVEAYRSSR